MHNPVGGKRDYQITSKGVEKIRKNKACVLFACADIETLSNKLQTIFWTFQKHYVNFSISHHTVPLTPMWCLSSSIMHQKYINHHCYHLMSTMVLDQFNQMQAVGSA